jgi:putative Holliday junction resolvase
VKATPAAAVILDVVSFADALPVSARLIGIDVGTKTLGLALSDLSRTIASGLETIRRTKFKADAARLIALVREHNIAGLVIGLPIGLDGSIGPRAQASRSFARLIGPMAGVPILMWDERLTTVEAERLLIEADASRKRRAEVIDKMAATLILQGALDRMRALQRSER